jgi:hypothetical protein
MEDCFYSAVHEKPYNHLEEEAFLKEMDPELYRALKERTLSLPGELVREYGLDAALYFLKREKAEGKAGTGTADSDEDALCGIFRFLGRVYRAFTAGGRPERNSQASSLKDEESTSADRFYALCARAHAALMSGHIHLYEADLAKALSLIPKGGGSREERELFLLLLQESAPCLSCHLLELEGAPSGQGRGRVRDLLERGKAGSEVIIQVAGRVRGLILVRPGEDPEEVIRRGERILGERGLDMDGFHVRYIPGKVISFWK